MAYSLSSSLHSDNSSYLLITSGTTPRWADPADNLTPTAHYTIGVYLTILGIVATLGNGAVLVLMQFTTVFRRKVQNLLLMALAWSDLILSVLGYPMSAASSFSMSWIFGDFVCRLHGFLVFMMSMVSMNTLVLIAIFRYVVICHPAHEVLLTVQTVRWGLGLAGLHAAIWTSLPLMGWSSYTYEPFGTACTINWLGTSFSDRSYIISTMVTCYVMQVSVISFCYVNIMCVARKLTFGWRPRTEATRDVLPVNEALWLKKIKAERTVTLTCVTMIAAYLVMWTPYAAISLLSMTLYIPMWMTVLPTLFAKMACAANPVIYCMLSRRFRRKIRILLRSSSKTHLVHTQMMTPSRSFAMDRIILHSLPERELVTKDGVYIGKNKAMFVAEGTLF